MKHLFQFFFVLFFWGSITSFFGCTSGPQLQKYPRSEIERPYTLPHGVDAWHIPTTFRYTKDNSGNTLTEYPIPNPLNWEIPFAETDDWNLLCYPFPFGVSHQFLKNDRRRVGMALTGGGISYGSQQGFRLSAGLSGTYREKLSDDLALEFNSSYAGSFALREGQPTLWVLALSVGPLFQLSNFFALLPKVNFHAFHGRAWINFGGLFGRNFDEPAVTYFSTGLGISGVWSFHRQWDLKPTYGYDGFFSENGIQSHVGTLEFVHYW